MFEQLVEYLRELRQLNRDGYHCPKEIAETIEKIREEIIK